mmetsp:Transcript_29602/g.71055  ORF Transcript_29602/g.71055 Transcript_29602/m.71055 type:complete len:203 (-) Transcript_29602:23-631(-)
MPRFACIFSSRGCSYCLLPQRNNIIDTESASNCLHQGRIADMRQRLRQQIQHLDLPTRIALHSPQHRRKLCFLWVHAQIQNLFPDSLHSLAVVGFCCPHKNSRKRPQLQLDPGRNATRNQVHSLGLLPTGAIDPHHARYVGLRKFAASHCGCLRQEQLTSVNRCCRSLAGPDARGEVPQGSAVKRPWQNLAFGFRQNGHCVF